MVQKKYKIETFINYVTYYILIMPKITIVHEKNGQTLYKLVLPKEVMENLAVKKGDRLSLLNVAGEQITFKLDRC